MLLKNLDTFVEIAKQKPKKKIAVAAAEDDLVLAAVAKAQKEGIAEPILVGNKEAIIKIANNIDFNLDGIEIIDEINPAESCRISVRLIRENKAQILMKGLVSSSDYLKAVLNKEFGLRKNQLLSHIGFFEIPAYHKVLALSDAAQNIAPTFEEKVTITDNAIDFFHRLGIANPKIAVVAAVETVNTKMPATIDAALLTVMNKRNQLKKCTLDGPLGFDIAISKEAAEHKGIISDVAGDPDMILVPEIETGNVLYKSFTKMAGASVAAIILGAACPIVLTSRADSDRSKYTSIALAASY